jgi:exodeoxyribonuclease-3
VISGSQSDESAATLLCWNVAGRVRRLAEQQARIIDLNPDVICLQETTIATVDVWRRRLADAGWPHHAVTDATDARATGRSRPLLAFTAARMPLDVMRLSGLPWPERVLVTRLQGLEIVNMHSPTSSKPQLAKVVTHEVVAAHLAVGANPRLVCGDFNTPRREHADGSVWTFARDRYGRLRPDRGERWDQAELALIKGLEQLGFRDAFRSVHGPAVRELSWEWQRWAGGYRIDHMIVSADVGVSESGYLHEWRKQGLSDHSPLYARIHWPAAATP